MKIFLNHLQPVKLFHGQVLDSTGFVLRDFRRYSIIDVYNFVLQGLQYT